MCPEETSRSVESPSTEKTTRTNAAPGTPEPNGRPADMKSRADITEWIQVFRAADGRIYSLSPPAETAFDTKTEPSPAEPKSQPSKAARGSGFTEWIEVYRAVDGRLWSPQENPDGTVGVILEGEDVQQLQRSPKMSGALPKDDDDDAGEQESGCDRSPSPEAVECVYDVPTDKADSGQLGQATTNDRSSTASTTSTTSNQVADLAGKITHIIL